MTGNSIRIFTTLIIILLFMLFDWFMNCNNLFIFWTFHLTSWVCPIKPSLLIYILRDVCSIRVFNLTTLRITSWSVLLATETKMLIPIFLELILILFYCLTWNQLLICFLNRTTLSHLSLLFFFFKMLPNADVIVWVLRFLSSISQIILFSYLLIIFTFITSHLSWKRSPLP